MKTPEELAMKFIKETYPDLAFTRFAELQRTFLAGYLAACEQRVEQNQTRLLQSMYEQRKQEWSDENT